MPTAENITSSHIQAPDSPLSPEPSTATFIIQRPGRCRLPDTLRLTTLIIYITIAFLCFCTPTTATPVHFSVSQTHRPLHRRQAIPDKFGNTGNKPGPVNSVGAAPEFTFSAAATSIPTLSSSSSSSAPSSAPTPSTASGSASVSSTSSTPSTFATPPTLTPGTGADGNTSPQTPSDLPNNTNPSPSPPLGPLTLTSPKFPLSAGAIAALAGGASVLLALLLGLAIFAYKRRRVDVSEIPIRRSKLGSRLGFRIFGDGNGNGGASRLGSRANSRSGSRANSRASSRSSERDEEKKGFEGALDKSRISRPKTAYVENGLLGVPRPLFAREERERERGALDVAPWLDKGTISAPRPGRPVSAEPLGRLSGMGLGMGYLK
ncbi:hypothetical protein K491DRAFT_722781 [Lophiostoma macrostomum CBS 122681]|uniref:Uncharacterized protein n=1 Tax=Lophiostoma macrostomum CBS 122681 TaxID=1314788 RepID=A0A6A6SPU1_9PLEO|nr:hypothetical protein K491DRAFT_722781 [Lophiostoma macrostomum CBS 122681]